MTNNNQVSVLSIDAWANGDGWDWNAWYNVGKIDVFVCDKKDDEILSTMVEEGYLKPQALEACYVDDDQYNKVICDKETHEPLFAIAYGELME